MDVLNSCGLNNCGWCREARGDMDWPGVVEDEGNGGGGIEREGSLVDEGSGKAESSGSGLGEGDKRLSAVGGGREGTEEEEEGLDTG